jgi:hypothetical protein
MRHLRFWCLVCSLPLFGAAPLRAADAADPLRLVPAQADLALSVPQPRRLVETLLDYGPLRQFRQLEAVAELYDSTNARRFNQLVAYFEKQLGLPWPEALDRLAGGGAAVAVKFGTAPAPALLVVQSTDEGLLRRFVQLGLDLIDQERARLDDVKEPRKESKYRGVPTVAIGKDFHTAVVGSALVISNKDQPLQHSIDLYLDGPAKSLAPSAQVAAARKLLPPNPLSWLWLNLGPAHRAREGKEIFALPNNQPQLYVVLGGWIDVVRRSPFLCAGLYRQGDQLNLTVRMPSGRNGMPDVLASHAPPPGQVGALPLLQPRGVLYSSSYYLDPARFWEFRKQLLNEQQLKGLEEFDKNSGRFLVGNRLSKLLAQVGPHQRLVVANQHHPGYQVQPGQRIPAFALVVDMRAPETFGKAMEAVLRGAAFLASTQVKLKLVEEQHGECKIVGYRFPEGGKLKGDDNYVRFNYSPCFVTVGDQFVASSTLELCHELVDLLQREVRDRSPEGDKRFMEAKARYNILETQLGKAIARLAQTKDVKERSQLIAELQEIEAGRVKCAGRLDALQARLRKGSPAAALAEVYAEGGAESLKDSEDQLLAQTILNQALAPAAAKQQVKLLAEMVRRLGVLRSETDYGANDFRFEIRLLPQSHRGHREKK